MAPSATTKVVGAGLSILNINRVAVLGSRMVATFGVWASALKLRIDSTTMIDQLMLTYFRLGMRTTPPPSIAAAVPLQSRNISSLPWTLFLRPWLKCGQQLDLFDDESIGIDVFELLFPSFTLIKP
jgi:hypothetical protein